MELPILRGPNVIGAGVEDPNDPCFGAYAFEIRTKHFLWVCWFLELLRLPVPRKTTAEIMQQVNSCVSALRVALQETPWFINGTYLKKYKYKTVIILTVVIQRVPHAH